VPSVAPCAVASAIYSYWRLLCAIRESPETRGGFPLAAHRIGSRDIGGAAVSVMCARSWIIVRSEATLACWTVLLSPTLFGFHELLLREKILRQNADDAGTRAVNVGDQEE
jgi:hypothetical protein